MKTLSVYYDTNVEMNELWYTIQWAVEKKKIDMIYEFLTAFQFE